VSSIAANQGRTFLQLLAELSPFIRSDRNLPGRIQQRLAKERRFGSRDRRLYRELLYTAVRFWPWIEEIASRGESEMLRACVWLAAPLPPLATLRSQVAAELGATPFGILDKARALGVSTPLLPTWIAHEAPEILLSPNVDYVHERAPLWLRLQTTRRDDVFAEFSERGWTWEHSPVFPEAVRLRSEADVTQTEAFQRGDIEVQDIGSQWVLAAAYSPCSDNPAAERWLDACAGAGGKTLQLARLLGSDGRVVAHDVRPEALHELSERARRAGLRNVEIARLPEGEFDGVVVDAPCSGSGTWRRSPHLKWCTGADSVQKAAQLQLTLLRRYAQHVRPGGRLIYATCSVCVSENEEVVNAFLKDASAFSPAPTADRFGAEARSVGHQLWPATLDSDGFYAASLVRAR